MYCNSLKTLSEIFNIAAPKYCVVLVTNNCRYCEAAVTELKENPLIPFWTLNIQENPEAINQFSIVGTPHYLFFENKKLKRTLSGFRTIAEINSVLD